MKALIFGLLLASPPVAAWMLRSPSTGLASAAPAAAVQTAAESAGSIQVPVEVVAKGNAPQWIYVEMRSEPVPEPGVLPLLLLPSLLLWRRRRD